MALATTQSNFRTHMKSYMDAAVKDQQAVYVTRSDDQNAVVSSQRVYNLLTDFANAKPGSAEYAMLRYDLVEAGIIQDASASYTADNLDDYFEGIRGSAESTI